MKMIIGDERKRKAEEFIGYCMDDVQNDLRRRERNHLIFPQSKKTRDQFPVALLGRGSLIVGRHGKSGDRYGDNWCYREDELTESYYFHTVLLDDSHQPCPVEVHYFMEESDDRGRFPEIDFILNLHGNVIDWTRLTKTQQDFLDRMVEKDAQGGSL